MRIVGALGVALAGLSVIGAVTAYGQIDTRSQYGLLVNDHERPSPDGATQGSSV